MIFTFLIRPNSTYVLPRIKGTPQSEQEKQKTNRNTERHVAFQLTMPSTPMQLIYTCPQPPTTAYQYSYGKKKSGPTTTFRILPQQSSQPQTGKKRNSQPHKRVFPPRFRTISSQRLQIFQNTNLFYGICRMKNSTPRYQHIRTGLDQQPSRITVHPTVYLYQGFRPASVYHATQFPHFI